MRDNIMRLFLHPALTQQPVDIPLVREFIQEVDSFVQYASSVLDLEPAWHKATNPEWHQVAVADLSGIRYLRYGLELKVALIEADTGLFEYIKSKVRADTQLSDAQKEKLLVYPADNDGTDHRLAWIQEGTNTSNQENTSEPFIIDIPACYHAGAIVPADQDQSWKPVKLEATNENIWRLNDRQSMAIGDIEGQRQSLAEALRMSGHFLITPPTYYDVNENISLGDAIGTISIQDYYQATVKPLRALYKEIDDSFYEAMEKNENQIEREELYIQELGKAHRAGNAVRFMHTVYYLLFVDKKIASSVKKLLLPSYQEWQQFSEQ